MFGWLTNLGIRSIIHDPKVRSATILGCHISYIIFTRIVRLLLLTSLLGAFIAAATALQLYSTIQLNSDLTSTQIAILCITLAAIFVSLVFLFSCCVEWWVVALFDSLFVVMIVSLAVVAIVRETQISSIGYQNYPGYNQGAFAAAGGLMLLAFLFYLMTLSLAIFGTPDLEDDCCPEPCPEPCPCPCRCPSTPSSSPSAPDLVVSVTKTPHSPIPPPPHYSQLRNYYY